MHSEQLTPLYEENDICVDVGCSDMNLSGISVIVDDSFDQDQACIA